MNVLVLNSGSSSLKFKLIDTKNEKNIFSGVVDGVGLNTSKIKLDGKVYHEEILNHDSAIRWILKNTDLNSIDAIGHRVVHGGEYYSSPVVITHDVMNKIDKLSSLAPLHNPPNLLGIKACKKLFPKIKQVAVFDTAFHQTMPEESYLYGIPLKFYKKYNIRKYGFHGTSHEYVLERSKQLLNKKKLNLITCHLGNGSSVCAIKNNESIDTSMGFTPLDGLMMGTRSGSIDPEIVNFLSKKEKIDVSAVETMLNKKSGFLGIAGYSDMRTIREKALKGNKKCKLAIEMFAYDVVSYIGSYRAIIGKIDGIVFTGGIGEGAFFLRERIIHYLEHFGIVLDKTKNKIVREGIITKPNSTIKVLVIPTNEELMIAKKTAKLLNLI